jgi:hypothetical protein
MVSFAECFVCVPTIPNAIEDPVDPSADIFIMNDSLSSDGQWLLQAATGSPGSVSMDAGIHNAVECMLEITVAAMHRRSTPVCDQLIR